MLWHKFLYKLKSLLCSLLDESKMNDGLVSRVSLSCLCKGLLDKDVTSKSDPIVQVLLLATNSRWVECGRTECIKNTLCPQFSKTVEVDYKFEEVQKIKFVVYDVDNASHTLEDDDFLGGLECTLGQIVSTRSFTKPLFYKQNKNAGTITIVAEEVNGESNDDVVMQFRADKLDKKDFFGKSDPYLEFSKNQGNGDYVVVHRTPHIKNTLNPRWQPFTISLQKLCSCNYDTKIKVTCYDYNKSGSHDLIGEFETSMAELSAGVQKRIQWDCVHPKKKAKKKKYINSGVVTLDSIKIVKKPTFLEYVIGGCQINFTVGVDFTASNGEPNKPNSLHFINPQEYNEYEKALIAVGEVCQDYDSDKLFPALGFGAKIPPNWNVSFEFALNFNMSNPYCEGIPGIVNAYQQCVRSVQLYGPTNVAPIVRHLSRHCQTFFKPHAPSAENYFVLLLLTDGVISDMDDTVSAIVEASYLPISIIIVGVGNADFAQMDFLDCDDGKLKSRQGREALRDIVQFVPFRDFKYAPAADLARCVLAELPQQVVEYFMFKGLQPNPPPPPLSSGPPPPYS